MIVQPNFLDHPKTRQLVIELDGDEFAPFYVLRLWGHCQNQKKSRFRDMSAATLCAICRANCSPQALWLSLQNVGFIRVEGQTLIVHEWNQYNKSLVNSWRNGKKGGRPSRKKAQPDEKPTGNPQATRGEPYREEKRREDSVCVGAQNPAPTDTHTHDSRLAKDHKAEIARLFPKHDFDACLRRAQRHVRKQRGNDAEVTLGWFVAHWMPREPEARSRTPEPSLSTSRPEPEPTLEQIAQREAEFRARFVDIPEPPLDTFEHALWSEARRSA